MTAWDWFLLFLAFAIGGLLGAFIGFLLGVGVNGAGRAKL